MQYIGNTDIAMKYCNRFPILLLAFYCSKPLAAAAWLQQGGVYKGSAVAAAAEWRQQRQEAQDQLQQWWQRR
jgi:hypothetical protein